MKYKINIKKKNHNQYLYFFVWFDLYFFLFKIIYFFFLKILANFHHLELLVQNQ